MARAAVSIRIWWGEVLLVDAIGGPRGALSELLAETGTRIVEDVAWSLPTSSSRVSLRVRSDGRPVGEVHDDGATVWQCDGLRIECRATSRSERVSRAPVDRTWWASVAIVALLLVGLGSWFRSQPERVLRDRDLRDRLAALSHLAARSAPSNPSRTPNVEHPATGSGANSDDPSERLPDTRDARLGAARAFEPGPSVDDAALRAVASRGILGLTVMTPRLARAMRGTLGAFASMNGAPIEGLVADDGRVHYGSMALGIGAGSGCPPGADCEPVTVRVTIGDSWRPRAASLASAAMQARRSATPVARPAPPEMGELTMAYVQQRVRRDVLADVQRCYNNRLETESDLPSGRVVVRFAVGLDGTVQDTSIVSTAIARRDIEDCIVGVIRRAHFPSNETGARVTYPFVFSSLMPDR